MVPFVLLETELPIPVIGFFFIAFAILLALLAGLLIFGKGRPHS